MFTITRSSLVAPLLVAVFLAAPVAGPALEEGRPFSTFLGSTLGGDKIELAAVRGERVLVVGFWATWSPPSLRQRTTLAAAMASRSADFLWVSVSLDRDVDAARGYIDANPTTAIPVCDGNSFEGAWATRFGVITVPSLFIIGRDGIVRRINTEAVTDAATLERLLAAGLAPYTASSRETTAAPVAVDHGLRRPATATVNLPAPDFTLKTVNGKGDVTLASLHGKVVLLVVFAPWNVNSANYLDEVVGKLYNRYRGNGFELVAVSIDKDQAGLLKWLKRKSFPNAFPVAIERPDDPAAVTFGRYPMGDQLPVCYMIGKNGVVRDIGELRIERIKQVLVEDLNVPF